MVRVRLSATASPKILTLDIFPETPIALELMLLMKLATPAVLAAILVIFLEINAEKLLMLDIFF